MHKQKIYCLQTELMLEIAVFHSDAEMCIEQKPALIVEQGSQLGLNSKFQTEKLQYFLFVHTDMKLLQQKHADNSSVSCLRFCVSEYCWILILPAILDKVQTKIVQGTAGIDFAVVVCDLVTELHDLTLAAAHSKLVICSCSAERSALQ